MGRSLSCAGGFIRQIAVQSWLQLCGSPRPCLSPVFVTHVLIDDGSRCQSEGETAVSQAPGEDIYIFSNRFDRFSCISKTVYYSTFF